MLHITPYSVAHYPLHCGALHIIYVVLGRLVVIVHLCIIYIGRQYSHLSQHCILSCLVYLVHCVRRFLPQRGLIFISAIHILGVDYSLMSISALFMLYLGLGCITFGIRALSLGLAYAKRVILYFF